MSYMLANCIICLGKFCQHEGSVSGFLDKAVKAVFGELRQMEREAKLACEGGYGIIIAAYSELLFLALCRLCWCLLGARK